MSSKPSFFKHKQFKLEIILFCVRWYLRYALTYRDLVEIMAELGVPKGCRMMQVSLIEEVFGIAA